MMKIILLIFLPLLLSAEFIKIDEQKILNIHNELRAKHFNAPLKYSKKLEKSSEKWAKHLGVEEGCKMIHSHNGNGENIFWQSALIYKSKKSTDKKWTITRNSKEVDASTPVKSWYNEIKFYNYDKNICKKDEMCGHYTQVIWKSTKEVGCAAYQCGDKSQVWVCQYHPAGNIIGLKPF